MLAASEPALGALPHCASVSESGASMKAKARRLQEQPASNLPAMDPPAFNLPVLLPVLDARIRRAPAGPRVNPVNGNRPARSCAENFGSAPSIHPDFPKSTSLDHPAYFSPLASKEG